MAKQNVFTPETSTNGKVKIRTLEDLENAIPTGKKGKVKFPKGTPANVKFQYIANRRVPMCVKTLEGVARLSNASVYSYSDQERDIILKLIGEAYANMVRALKHPRKNASVKRNVRIFS